MTYVSNIPTSHPPREKRRPQHMEIKMGIISTKLGHNYIIYNKQLLILWNMTKKISTTLRIATVLLCLHTLPLRADYYSDYIERYADMAVEQEREFGIPASITMAQGLLESAAGRSTLATQGNNHFGIKCHATWTGATMLRDDDAPDECFRVYTTPAESYTDHSKFLCGKRYRPLFQYAVTDYQNWARGLSACGYATDPQYAERLITIIERYGLYSLGKDRADAERETADFIFSHLRDTHIVRKSRGLHYVIATPGDTYSSIASELHIDPATLATLNDAKPDTQIPAWQEVYLQPKLTTAPEGIYSATIGADESMHSLSQRYGMQLATLRQLNPKAKDRPGERLRLRISDDRQK